MTGARLKVLTGFIAGKELPLPSSGVLVGRGDEAGLQFDPHQDLQVSTRHCTLSPSSDGWVLQDLGSLNGTFVNGHRITGPVLLRDGDRIQLGDGGPMLEFQLSATASASPASASPAAAFPAPASAAVSAPAPPFEDSRPDAPSAHEGAGSSGDGGTPEPPAVRKGSGVRGPVALLSVVLLAVILASVYLVREGRRYRNQVAVMQERIDSILEASAETAGEFQGRIQGLHDALLESRQDLETVRRDLEAAEEGGDSDEIRALRVQLQEAQAALVRHQLAANLDYDAIEAGNGRAVAKVFVDFGDEVVTATAFAVRSDGTLMTNRHVVAGPTGTRTPRRVAVQFADSRQVWPARVLATSRTVDLALLKVDNIVGEVPTVTGFEVRAGALREGQGVGVIGFPLGGAEPSGADGADIARTILTAGIVQAVRPDLLEVNGYGVEGSSGSPVFDGDGRVVGVLFGGRVDDGERTLFAVPAARAAAFLREGF